MVYSRWHLIFRGQIVSRSSISVIWTLFCITNWCLHSAAIFRWNFAYLEFCITVSTKGIFDIHQNRCRLTNFYRWKYFNFIHFSENDWINFANVEVWFKEKTPEILLNTAKFYSLSTACIITYIASWISLC